MARIVVDAMGSDDFPTPDVEGSVRAARRIWSGDHPRRRRIKNQAGAGRAKPGQFAHPNRPRARDADHGRQRRSADIQSAAWTKLHGCGHGPGQEW